MKHLNTNQEFRLNEILFEHRNKEYGAYVLRNESNRILTKALFIGVSLLAAVSITPLIISAFTTPEVIPTAGGYELPPPINIVEPDDPPATVVPPTTASAPDVKTFDATLPEPTAHVTKEKVVEKIEGAVAGTKNNPEGEIALPDKYVPTTQIIKTGPITIPVQPPVIPVKNPNAIETELSVSADYEGGINSFRNKVISNFDGSGFETDGLMKTTVTFIVETNGTISGLKADGKDANFNSEAIRTIKSIRGKWVPGKNKQGEAVRSYFKFPISMKFDN